MKIVTWKTVNYNCGRAFNGTYFKAPVKGIYSFYVTVTHASDYLGYIYLNKDGSVVAQASRQSYTSRISPIVLQATLQLERGNKVQVRLDGYLTEASFHIDNRNF